MEITIKEKVERVIIETVENTYVLKWQLKFDNNYKITECKKIINTKTKKIIKETKIGYTIGYWFGKKFVPKTKLNDYVEKININ